MLKSTGNRAARGAFFPLFLAPCVLLAFSACVAQDKYDESQLNAKHYQTKTLDAETRASQLEDENRRLKAQLEASNQAVDANFDRGAIDEQLKNLQRIVQEIGGQPGDVTKFSVDGGYVYRVKDSILFGLGSSDISSDGQKVLGEVAADIKSRPHGKVYVRGHTDTTPISKPETLKRYPRGNLQLSAARAVEVAAYLSGNGQVEENRLVVMGFGPSDPVAANDTDSNRQKNRRVDIFVADEDKSVGTATNK